MTGYALGKAPGVDEDDRGFVRLDQLGKPVVDLVPGVARDHRLQRRTGQLEREIRGPPMPGIDQNRRGCRLEPAAYLLDRLDRGGQADSLNRLGGNMAEPLEGESQVGSPSRLDHCMDLVHDYGPN